jgi:hypothetical protein
MGKILPSYKKSLYDELIDNISTGTSNYYAFGANPIAYSNGAPTVTGDDYSTTFVNDWQLMFGKKLSNTNFLPVIDKNIWASNTVYNRYDNTSNTLYDDNNFYVVCEPAVSGGSYHVYKCIDNANGVVSTVDPSSVGTPTQPNSFKTNDGYQWRYITSISNEIYNNFSTTNYVPIYPNTSIQTSAFTYSGVDVVMIVDGGSGYTSYANGVIKSVVNSTVVEIESSSSDQNDYYTKNSIYLENLIGASQLRNITSYVANGSGRWVYLDEAANTSLITASVTTYKISPRVVFDTDGTAPKAISTVNPDANNSIYSITVLDPGLNISRANVYIQSNTSYGSGANLYAIVPTAGGHGVDPATELGMKGIGVSFSFDGSESSTLLTANVLYNKIGIYRNPYGINANGSKSATLYNSNTFDQVLKANVSPSHTFTLGETITGVSSNAKGTVVFSNGSQVYITGDKYFTDGEGVSNSAGLFVANISINNVGSIYSTDLKPLYVQNINNVNRSNTQTESFKLVIQI